MTAPAYEAKAVNIEIASQLNYCQQFSLSFCIPPLTVLMIKAGEKTECVKTTFFIVISFFGVRRARSLHMTGHSLEKIWFCKLSLFSSRLENQWTCKFRVLLKVFLTSFITPFILPPYDQSERISHLKMQLNVVAVQDEKSAFFFF